MKAAVVFAAGPVSPEALELLRPKVRGRSIAGRPVDIAVAADGGLDLALRLGLEPDIVIGDMDSVTRESLESAGRGGVDVREFPTAKDESDYELAIAAAIAAGAQRVTVVGSDAGRIDHLYATLFTLSSPRFSTVPLDAWLGGNYLAVLNGRPRENAPAETMLDGVNSTSRGIGEEALLRDTASMAALDGTPGAQVSLFAMNGKADGVTSTGLRWKLDGDTLGPGTSRGVSNEMLEETATVRIESGCLAVVMPVAEAHGGAR